MQEPFVKCIGQRHTNKKKYVLVKNVEITEVNIFVHGQHVVAWCHHTYSCKRKGSKKNRNMVVYGVILTKFGQLFKLG